MSVFFFFFSSRRRHTRFKCDWSSDVCSSDLKLAGGPSGETERHRDTGNAADGQAIVPEADAGETAFFALRVFVGEEVKGFVFLERAANREPRLRARVGLLYRIKNAGRRINLTGERVSRLEGFITEIAKDIAVDLVGAALGDDVDHAASGAAVFRVVIAED